MQTIIITTTIKTIAKIPNTNHIILDFEILLSFVLYIGILCFSIKFSLLLKS